MRNRPQNVSAVRRAQALVAGIALALAAGCRAGPPPSTTAAVLPQVSAGVRYDPARDLGRLFHDVQMSGLFEDSKTFVDARPLLDPAQIAARYNGSDLKAF